MLLQSSFSGFQEKLQIRDPITKLRVVYCKPLVGYCQVDGDSVQMHAARLHRQPCLPVALTKLEAVSTKPFRMVTTMALTVEK